MKFSWRTEWPHVLLLAAMLVLAATSWSSAPDRIPVHWGLAGQPDRYGGRFEGLLSLPLEAIGLYVLLLLLPRIDPGKANYPTFATAYATLRLVILVVIAGLYAFVLLSMRGIRVDVSGWAPVLAGGLLVVVGNLLGKVRPNWFVGVRTPWTLSSRRSWNRTHRLAGWLFVCGGVLLMATAPVHARWTLLAVMVLLLAGVVGLVVYSYLQWKSDPNKIPPAGTTPE